jgi:hypothetical protein
MEFISFYCDKEEYDECKEGYAYVTNYDTMKRIISSNYITKIRLCMHNSKKIKDIILSIPRSNEIMLKWHSNIKLIIFNKNYLSEHGIFFVQLNRSKCLKFKEGGLTGDKVTTKYFLNNIKNGTVITFVNDEGVIPVLRKFLETNNFTLKETRRLYSNSASWLYLIDTPTLTKPAAYLGKVLV